MLRKGQRITASWFRATTGSLAGVQPKFPAVQESVTGVVTHIRGDHPVHPTTVRVWVQPDGGGDEVIIDPAWIKAVLS